MVIVFMQCDKINLKGRKGQFYKNIITISLEWKKTIENICYVYEYVFLSFTTYKCQNIIY